jgi:hypothetical protein
LKICLQAEIDRRYLALVTFVRQLSATLVPEASKKDFLDYLEDEWFGNDCEWRSPACRIRLFLANPASSVSSLNSTNNGTERLFKDMQESGYNNYLNKKLSTEVMTTDAVQERQAAVVRQIGMLRSVVFPAG